MDDDEDDSLVSLPSFGSDDDDDPVFSFFNLSRVSFKEEAGPSCLLSEVVARNLRLVVAGFCDMPQLGLRHVAMAPWRKAPIDLFDRQRDDSNNKWGLILLLLILLRGSTFELR